MIALTFDDGPGERTLELLETLEKYNVRASFFMCGTSLSRNDIKDGRNFKRKWMN